MLRDLNDKIPLFIADSLIRDLEGGINLGQLAPLKVDVYDRPEDLRDTT
jgi:hypothetical protein